jgi:hypothetical protein
MFAVDPQFWEMKTLEKEIFSMRVLLWQKQFLGVEWWINLSVFFLSWFIWLKCIDRSRFVEILLFGVIVDQMVVAADEVGSMAVLWGYPFKVLPFFPRFLSVDYGVLPVTYMLIYQYCADWKSFFWVLTTMSAIFSFIAEPLLTRINFYVMFNWLHIYSFPLYIALGLSCKWIINKVFNVQERSKKHDETT